MATEGKKILVVEDESIIAMDIRSILESFGYTVPAVTSSGEEALKLAEQLAPDLVLMDIALAGPMTGIEAAEATTERLGIPVLFLTANSDMLTFQKAKITGPMGYVMKPFEHRELEVAVEMALYRAALEAKLKGALEKAETERAKTEAIVSALGAGISIQNTSFRVTYQNSLHRELFGDCVGGRCHHSFHRRECVCLECPLVHSYRDGATVTIEKAKMIGGIERILEITVSTLTDSAGAVTAAIELVRDVTERKRTEQALAENEERYRKLVELSPDAVVVSTDGIIDFGNVAALELAGAIDLREIAGRSLLDFVHPDYHGVVGERTRLIIETGHSAPLIEEKIVRLDGTVLDVETASVPFLYHGRRSIQTIIRDISDRKRTEELIRQMAYYDPLTGLPNRRLFDDRLNQALAQARRHRRIFAVLFVDLDHFKRINDTLGHAVGDELLKGAAERLKDCCRRTGDTVARFGGDEFTILLPELDSVGQIVTVVRNIMHSFKAEFMLSGQAVRSSLSIGVSIFPHDGEDAATLLKKADSALYQAKDQGRDTCCFHNRMFSYHAGDLTSDAAAVQQGEYE